MSKLTLSVDATVAEEAKRFAKSQGTSVSSIVEEYLKSIVRQPGQEGIPSVLKAIRGSLRRGEIEEYQEHLVKKNR